MPSRSAERGACATARRADSSLSQKTTTCQVELEHCLTSPRPPSKVAADLDFILVVGGWDSSNTAHLLEIPVHAGVVAYHINVPSCIAPDNSITHRTVAGAIETTPNFLRLDRPTRIGVTSGASTPDSVVQECLEQLVLLKSLGVPLAA